MIMELNQGSPKDLKRNAPHPSFVQHCNEIKVCPGADGVGTIISPFYHSNRGIGDNQTIDKSQNTTT